MIKLNVKGKDLKLPGYAQDVYVEGGKHVRFQFKFDKSWEGLLVQAVFMQDGTIEAVPVDYDDIIHLPDWIDSGSFGLTLRGFFEDQPSKRALTTNMVVFQVKDREHCHGTTKIGASSINISQERVYEILENVQALQQYVDKNVIESVLVNGSEIPIVDKTVDIPIPELVSELVNDADYQNLDQVKELIDQSLTTGSTDNDYSFVTSEDIRKMWESL